MPLVGSLEESVTLEASRMVDTRSRTSLRCRLSVLARAGVLAQGDRLVPGIGACAQIPDIKNWMSRERNANRSGLVFLIVFNDNQIISAHKYSHQKLLTSVEPQGRYLLK